MSKDNHLDLSKIAQKVMKNVRNLFKNKLTNDKHTLGILAKTFVSV